MYSKSFFFCSSIGISLFILNAGRNSSCEHSNIELIEMRKYTIRDWHQRKLCRTKITMSINSKTCEKTNSDLFAFCQRTKEKSSIFFKVQLIFVQFSFYDRWTNCWEVMFSLLFEYVYRMYGCALSFQWWKQCSR